MVRWSLIKIDRSIRRYLEYRSPAVAQFRFIYVAIVTKASRKPYLADVLTFRCKFFCQLHETRAGVLLLTVQDV